MMLELGSTRTYGCRKQLVGEIEWNSQVTRWLIKRVLIFNSTEVPADWVSGGRRDGRDGRDRR
eukprot:9469234-Pyramimonas_sp.AAC.2